MQKYRWKDGSVHYYQKAYKKWVKYKNSAIKKRRSHINREPSDIFSKRFGYVDVYNRREQNYLMCPSGFSFTQGMGKLYKLWRGYTIAKTNEKDIERAIGFAKDIQKVQEDLGLKTTSFPHLGIYGDIFKLYETKKRPAVEENHSHLKESQQLLEKKHEIITIADEMNKIRKKEIQIQLQEQESSAPASTPAPAPTPVPLLLTPNTEQEIQIFTDDIPVELEPLKSKPIKIIKQAKKRKIKHENRMPYKHKEPDWHCKKCGEEVLPHSLEAWDAHSNICKAKAKAKEKELEVLIMADTVPFQ